MSVCAHVADLREAHIHLHAFTHTETHTHTCTQSQELAEVHKFNLASCRKCRSHTSTLSDALTPHPSSCHADSHCAPVMKHCVLHSHLTTEPITQRTPHFSPIPVLSFHSPYSFMSHFFPLAPLLSIALIRNHPGAVKVASTRLKS